MTEESIDAPFEIPERTPVNIDSFVHDIKSNVEKNSFLLPDLLDISVIKDVNLFSIYKESYFCILCGYYNSGILLLGQLMEITLKEIVFIKTNELKKGTFGKALEYAYKNKLIFKEDFEFLLRFKNEIRDPHTHRDFRKILGYHFMPSWSIPTGDDPDESLKNLQKAQDGIKSGKYPPQFIDAASSSVTATLAKEQVDETNAIYWAWMVYSELEQLLAIYLTQESYNEYQKKYGSPFEKIAQLRIDEEDIE